MNVYINYEKKFAFVEFRTVDETSNAMALDGIMFEGVSVRVRRPNDYNAAAAASLGPSQPSANLNLAAIGLQVGCRMNMTADEMFRQNKMHGTWCCSLRARSEDRVCQTWCERRCLPAEPARPGSALRSTNLWRVSSGALGRPARSDPFGAEQEASHTSKLAGSV